jgi:DNA-binding XRE family transcriptional regulator
MTQEELAKRLDVKRLTIIRWESSETEIPKAIDLAMKEIERLESR